VKILLTGATGFLGSALALHWLKAGHEVAMLMRPTSSTKRLLGLDTSFVIERYQTDGDLAAFVKNTEPKVVVHTACAYGREGETSMQLLDTNLRLGLVILEALAALGQPVSFINTGSALPPDVSYYAISKQQFSKWGRLFTTQFNGRLKFINVLLQQMYGPGDDPSKFAMHVLYACSRNDPELRLTAGEQTRDCIYIDDVVSAYDTLLNQHYELDAALDIEVGTGVAPTIRHFVETAHRLTESQTKLLFGAIPYRPNEAMHCVADTTRMNQLGWAPTFGISDGLKKTIELEFN